MRTWVNKFTDIFIIFQTVAGCHNHEASSVTTDLLQNWINSRDLTSPEFVCRLQGYVTNRCSISYFHISYLSFVLSCFLTFIFVQAISKFFWWGLQENIKIEQKYFRWLLNTALVRSDFQLLAEEARYPAASQYTRMSDDDQVGYAQDNNSAPASRSSNSVDGSQTIEAGFVL